MVTMRVRFLPFISLLALAAPVAVSAGGFPISAIPAQDESAQGIAFDGVNFLVAIQGGGQRAQLVSPSGALLASVFVPGAFGDPPLVAFDGTNYLLAWNEPTSATPGIWCQRVTTAGSLSGTPFKINQVATVRQLEGIAFDGLNYLVVWTTTRPLVSQLDVYGRFVPTSGTPVSPEFQIDGNLALESGRDPRVAFGGSRYLVAWTEDSSQAQTLARFVGPDGTLQPTFTVNASAQVTGENPGNVAFDGTNFLVVWADDVGGIQELDFFGQLVSPLGTPVGGVIPIATGPGLQLLPYIAFDGVNYLVIWTDLSNDTNDNPFDCQAGEGTCADVYGQLVSPAGTLVGTNFGVEVDAGNQGQSPIAYGAGKYLAVWTRNFESSGDVYGTFLFDTLDYFSLAPCRVVDTRGGAPIGGPVLQGQETRTFAVAGHCAIPATAMALSINLAVAQSTAAGNVRLFPAGQSVPTVSTINYRSGQTRGNNAIISLSPSGMAAFVGQPASTTVHLILDVNGYFE